MFASSPLSSGIIDSNNNVLHTGGTTDEVAAPLSLSEIETAALRALKEELSNIPHDEKSALVHVQRIQPDLVDDDHLVSFLRVEKFDVDVSVFDDECVM